MGYNAERVQARKAREAELLAWLDGKELTAQQIASEMGTTYGSCTAFLRRMSASLTIRKEATPMLDRHGRQQSNVVNYYSVAPVRAAQVAAGPWRTISDREIYALADTCN